MYLKGALDSAQYHHMRKSTIKHKSEQENFAYARLMFSTTCKYNSSKQNEPIKRIRDMR
jgi:hypothetical protein